MNYKNHQQSLSAKAFCFELHMLYLPCMDILCSSKHRPFAWVRNGQMPSRWVLEKTASTSIYISQTYFMPFQFKVATYAGSLLFREAAADL